MSLSSSGNANLTGEDNASKGGIATTTPNQSMSVGYNAAPLSVGSMNAFVGFQVALYSRTGSYNVVVGSESALRLASSYNCVLGYSAATALVDGGATTVVGALAGATVVSGRANTLVGCAADVGAGGVEDAVAVGAAASVGANGGVAIGAGATAGGALSLAVGSGAQTAGEGEINIMNRVRGFRAASTGKYTLELNADLTRLRGALAFSGSSGSGSSWAVFADAASKDLVFLSDAGVSTRLTGSFRPGVLNFTGQHRCKVAAGEDLRALRPGAVVVATGAYCDLEGRADLLDVDEALPMVALCRRARDPRVFGVVSAVHAGEGCREFQVGTVIARLPGRASLLGRVSVNSAGEGGVLVCGQGGDIRNGDLLVASDTPGVCMRQRQRRSAAQGGGEYDDDEDEDDVVRACTVAKVTCDCFFGEDTDEIKLVGCTYRM
jgi:hypothetical protein